MKNNQKNDMRNCETCMLNITYMQDRTDCLKCANGEKNSYVPIENNKNEKE